MQQKCLIGDCRSNADRRCWHEIGIQKDTYSNIALMEILYTINNADKN